LFAVKDNQARLFIFRGETNMKCRISYVALPLMTAVFTIVNLACCEQAMATAAAIGDVDLDGDLDADDANLLTTGIAAGSMDFNLDVDFNGVVDSADLDIFFAEYSLESGVPLSTALVDVNFDTVNDSTDYYIILGNQGLASTNFTSGNLFVDGGINTLDLNLYLNRGGVIPEPGTMCLAATAVVLGLSRKRRV
jgi:hypothetical protein